MEEHKLLTRKQLLLMINRRQAIKQTAMLATTAAASLGEVLPVRAQAPQPAAAAAGPFTLPPLLSTTLLSM